MLKYIICGQNNIFIKRYLFIKNNYASADKNSISLIKLKLHC